jgi:hypothetical protein
MYNKPIDDNYEALRWAFTSNPNDYRFRIFAKALNLLGERTKINKNDLITELMIAKYYNDKSDLYDTDIHYEFTNFLLNTALHHSMIDNSSELSFQGKKMFDNVYKKWYGLPEIAKIFYKKFFDLMILDQNGNKWNVASDYNNLQLPLNYYRINMKKHTKEFTVFQQMLPKVPKFMGRIPIKIGVSVIHVPASKNILKLIYFCIRQFLIMVKEIPAFINNMLNTNNLSRTAIKNKLDENDRNINATINIMSKKKGKDLDNNNEGEQRNNEEQINEEMEDIIKTYFKKDAELLEKFGTEYDRKNNGEDDKPKHEEIINYIIDQLFNIVSDKLLVFNVNVDNIVRAKIAALQGVQEAQDIELSKIDKNIYDISSMWYKTADGSIFRYVDGVRVDCDVKKSNFTKTYVTLANNCYSSLFTGDSEQCKNVLTKCIFNDNTQSAKDCVEALRHVDMNKVIVSEIQNIHPLVALGILKKLNFRTRSVTNDDGTSYLEMESVSHWAKEYAETNGENYATFVTSNMNMIKYLNLLVQYVDNNPGILNPEYADEINNKMSKRHSFKGSAFAEEIGIPKREIPMSSAYDSAMFKRHFKLGRMVMTGGSYPYGPFIMQRKRLISPFKMHTLTPHRFSFNNHVTRRHADYDYVYDLIHTLKRELEHKGKKFDPTSEKYITDIMKSHKQNELVINKIISTLELYNSYIDLFSDYKSELLNMDNLNKIAKMYKNRITNRGDLDKNLYKTFNKLEKLLDEEDDEYKNIKI